MNSMLIKGNNLDVLEYLKKDYSGIIDLVYIDPPFNTSQVFSVDKERVSTISRSKNNEVVAYDDRFSREDYLAYMKQVTKKLHTLMSDAGTLYLHIDCNFNHYLRVILDEVFGYQNFMNEIARIKCNPKNSKRKAWGNNHDIILVYAKNKGKNIWNEVRLIRESDKKRFKKQDEHGFYTTVPLHAPGETQNGDTGKPWHGMNPPAGRHWRVSPTELTQLDKAGKIEWSKTGNPRMKKYFDDYKGSLAQDTWLDYKDPQNPTYPTQKNAEMLELIVKQSSNENSIVLDCFSGSGSTLVSAVKTGRTFIGIDKSDVAIKVAKDNLREQGEVQFDCVDFSQLGELGANNSLLTNDLLRSKTQCAKCKFSA